MAYATVDDLETRWRTLSDDEKIKAGVLLEDAAALIDSAFKSAHKELDPVALGRPLRVVSCAIVKRAMTAPEGDYTQYSTTAGSFSEQMSFNADGWFGLKRAKKAMLGLLRSGVLANVSLTGSGERIMAINLERYAKTYTFRHKVFSGQDRYGNDEFTWQEEDVYPVLKNPISSQDNALSIDIDGVIIKNTLVLAKGYTRDLTGSQVKINGEWMDVYDPAGNLEESPNDYGRIIGVGKSNG